MAEQQHPPAIESERLRAAAAETRLRAIRSQIAIGLTFCCVAESELEHGWGVKTNHVIEKLHKVAETMHRHLNEPNHVPSAEVETVRVQLAHLESRILAVEERQRRDRR